MRVCVCAFVRVCARVCGVRSTVRVRQCIAVAGKWPKKTMYILDRVRAVHGLSIERALQHEYYAPEGTVTGNHEVFVNGAKRSSASCPECRSVSSVPRAPFSTQMQHMLTHACTPASLHEAVRSQVLEERPNV